MPKKTKKKTAKKITKTTKRSPRKATRKGKKKSTRAPSLGAQAVASMPDTDIDYGGGLP